MAVAQQVRCAEVRSAGRVEQHCVGDLVTGRQSSATCEAWEMVSDVIPLRHRTPFISKDVTSGSNP